jgi:hypothetical protein
MTLPRFNILTQKELTIDLSRPAMQYIIAALEHADEPTVDYQVECELDNFTNLLQNLLERSEPKPGNLDLIGE